jgi:methanogenic corrinoid protein MtbC1
VSDIRQIEKLINTYFDALYECDVNKLAEVLHERALYACIEDEKLLTRNMNEYLPIVSNRESPKSKGEKRRDKIVFIDAVSSNTAMVKVNCSIGERLFTDYLSLLKVDSEWKILSKVFHFDLMP